MRGPGDPATVPPLPDPQEQLRVLLPGTAEVTPRDELGARVERSFREARPLRVKLGIDPSRPDLTLGHSVVLRKLRQFQDLGHTAVLIVGDFTGLVGDPSGRSETRPMLSAEEIEANATTYFEQAGLIVDMARAEVRGNAEWLGSMRMADVLRLTATTTVAQVLDREDFSTRYRKGHPIAVVELLYPLMQAMDSVAVRADVELGGTDQTFNLLMGREVQRAYGQEPQVVMTMPLLVGTDGIRKMSKSLDNYVALTDPAEEMFGKLMSLPDALIGHYLRLCTATDPDEIGHVEAGLSDGSLHAGEQKRRMARVIVAVYHGADAAFAAERRFDLVHREHGIPDDVPARAIPAEVVNDGRVWVPRLLAAVGLVGSNGEGRRLIAQGAVRIDGRTVTDLDAELDVSSLAGRVVQVGRRRFVRLTG
jgi:tyrosyl-tRNA synthetase